MKIFFYRTPIIKYILERNPEQVVFILTGLLFSLVGLIMLFYTRIIDIRLKLEQTPEKE